MLYLKTEDEALAQRGDWFIVFINWGNPNEKPSEHQRELCNDIAPLSLGVKSKTGCS